MSLLMTKGHTHARLNIYILFKSKDMTLIDINER